MPVVTVENVSPLRTFVMKKQTVLMGLMSQKICAVSQ